MKNISLNLVWANFIHRPLNSSLTVATLAAAVALLSLILQAGGYTEHRVKKDLAGVDLVVGAKGSPVQLILSSLLHLDVPTGNISLEDAQTLMRDRQIRRAVPLALGDSFRGFRIVGTSSEFLDLYQAELARGMLWRQSQDVVIGATVSRTLDMQVGQQFFGAHGLSNSGEGLAEHAHAAFKVTGVLEPTGSVLDRLILTPVESVWDVHGQEDHEEPHSDEHSSAEHGGAGHEDAEHGEAGHADEEHAEEDDVHHENDHHEDDHSEEGHSEEGHSGHDEYPLDDISNIDPHDREVTALLVQYASPLAAVRLPRMINSQAGMQAAAPAMEITRLFSLSSGFTSAGKIVAVLLAVIGGLSIFTAVSSAVAAKRYDIALMRAMGAPPHFIFRQQLFEGMLIATLSAVVGILTAHFAVFLANQLYAPLQAFGLNGLSFFATELYLLIGTILLGAIAALWPAIACFRIDPAVLLQQGR